MSLEDLESNPQKVINKCKYLINRIKPHNRQEYNSLNIKKDRENKK